MKKEDSSRDLILWIFGFIASFFILAISSYSILHTFLSYINKRIMDIELMILFLKQNNILDPMVHKDRLLLNICVLMSAGIVAYALSKFAYQFKIRYTVSDKNWVKPLFVSFLGIILLMLNLLLPIEDNKYASLCAGFMHAIGFCMVSFFMSKTYNIVKQTKIQDRRNEENESFEQEERRIETPHSVNLKTEYYYGKKKQGYINILNPQSGVLIIGQPGSGKTGSLIEPIIEQHIEKGFTGCIYDFKYPSLTEYAYSALKTFERKNKAQFYVINFQDPKYSHRCNPLIYLKDMGEAMELTQSFLMNLAKNWSDKRGDFFVESAMNLFAAVIWFLKKYQNGAFCSLPHVIELITAPDNMQLLELLSREPEVAGLVNNFLQARAAGAVDQVSGQISSPQVMLGRVISPSFYWALSGNDFSLDINNPDAPKILCLANNPDRQETYGTALGLYLSKIISTINRPDRLPCSIVLDELPTVFVRKLDNLIATARSNKISTIIGIQDIPQLEAGYGKVHANIVFGLPRNIICGSVSIDTAKRVHELFGKIKQPTISDTEGRITERIELASRIPADKLTGQQTGHFSGVLAHDYGYSMKNVFSSDIKLDSKIIKHKLPEIDSDASELAVIDNFYKIKNEAKYILTSGALL